MKRAELEEYIIQKYGSVLERPFEKDQSTVVFRHGDNRKWFAILMNVPRAKFEANSACDVDIINIKCSQDIICSLWKENGIYPAYHMNKAHWLTVLLDGSADDDTLLWLVDMSFKLTSSKKKNK